ncbi:MAG TPA: hypothetical protein VFA78_09540 [Chloroflexota bacterium]|nr:hypothetical protein [Chloroflexota bacterium]
MNPVARFIHGLWELADRERRRILAEVLQVQGLMPLLMKPRNGQRWTRDDRVAIQAHLRQLASTGPYLIALLLPAAPVTLPLLAWWLDRRRIRRQGDAPGRATDRTIG